MRSAKCGRGVRSRRSGSGWRAGCIANYLGAIECGEINPTFAVLLKVAAGLAVSLSELLALYELRRDEAA